MRIQSKFKTHFLLIPAILLVGILTIGTLGVVNSNKDANALSAAADFNAGNIIDDAVFYNKDTMNVQQIQDFLNRLIPSCDTWGTRASGYGNLNNAQYAQQIMGWHGPPYACLNNYHENPNNSETSFEKGGGSFIGGISAAQIIYNAAQTYGINPQVLLVLLKKESAGPLTADTWPIKSQYRYAMGYACPDSGPGNSANCSAERAGFYKQITTAAWQLKYYKDNSNNYRYKIGWNDIQYSPDASCGTKRVNIENVATLSLYIYTPYTPNEGALNNYPGTAPCGAYGNRNFFMFFSDWFGTTRANPWSNLTSPRIMVTNKATNKINPFTKHVAQQLPAGQEVRFDTKFDNCLRTRHDTKNNINTCIKIEDLHEFSPTIQYIDNNSAVFYSVKQPTCKVHYLRDDIEGQCLEPGTIVAFQQKLTVMGVEYLITRNDSKFDKTLAYRKDRLDGPVDWSNLTSPRIMVTNKATNKINPFTEEVVQQLPAGQEVRFETKMDDCLRTEHDTRNDIDACIKVENLSKFTSIGRNISPDGLTSYHEVLQFTCKVDYAHNIATDQCFTKGTTLAIQREITISGTDYYLTRNDSLKNIMLGFRKDRLKKVD